MKRKPSSRGNLSTSDGEMRGNENRQKGLKTLQGEKKESVSVPRYSLFILSEVLPHTLHTQGLSYSFVQGHVKRGPGTETPVPPQWAALGCGLALWAAGQLSLTAPSNTVHPTPLTLSESGRGAQLPWGSWQVVSGRQGDCISGGECGMRCLDGSGWPYFIVSL